MWRKDFKVQYRNWEFVLELELVDFVADSYEMAEVVSELQFSQLF